MKGGLTPTRAKEPPSLDNPRLSATVSPKQRHSKEIERRHFEVLFIGGGPSVLGLLAHAAKHNRLTDLLGGKGVGILEAGPYFGSGALSDYLINSNTSADSFLRVTYKKIFNKKPEESKTPTAAGAATFRGLSTSPQPHIQGLSKEVSVCSPFKDLYISEIGRCIRSIGKEQASLSLIAYFLSYVGNHLLAYIFHTFKKKIFFPYHRVLSLQQTSSGEYLAYVQRTHMGQGGRPIQFIAKSVVVGIGGQQKIPESLDFKLGIPKSRFVLGEPVLKKEGFIKLLQKIESEKPRNVVIVGGSHTGFSIAWLLLNGPVDYSQAVAKDRNHPFFKSSGPFNMAATPVSKGHATSYPKGPSIVLPTGAVKRCPPEECGANGPDCFGKVREPPLCLQGVHFKALPDFGPGGIKILCKNAVRVYYSELRQARKDNYEEFPGELYKNDKTTVYPFSGLRGDAKKLYHKIKKGQEERVRLVHIANSSAQKAFLANADLVIWACGFGTKESFHIYDEKQRRIPLNREPWLVNAHCEMLRGNGDGPSQPFGNLYGVGLGYSYLLWEGEWDREKRQKALAMRAGQPWRNLNIKADSFSYYMTSIAERLFGRILSKPDTNDSKTGYSRQINLSTSLNKRKPTLAEAVATKPLNKQASANSLTRRATTKQPHEETKKASTLVMDGSVNSINRHTSSSLKKVSEEGIRSKSEHTAQTRRSIKSGVGGNLQNSPYEKAGPFDGKAAAKTTQRRSGQQIIHAVDSPKKMQLKKEARYSTPARPKNEIALAAGQTAISGAPALGDLDPNKIKLKQDYFPSCKDKILTPSKRDIHSRQRTAAIKQDISPIKPSKIIEDDKAIATNPLPVKTLFYGNAARAGNISIVSHDHTLSSSKLKGKTHTRGSGSAHLMGTTAKPLPSSRGFHHEASPLAVRDSVMVDPTVEVGSHSFSNKDSPYNKESQGYSSSAVVVSKKTPSSGVSLVQRSGVLHRGSLAQKKPSKPLYAETYSRREGQYLGLIGQKLG